MFVYLDWLSGAPYCMSWPAKACSSYTISYYDTLQKISATLPNYYSFSSSYSHVQIRNLIILFSVLLVFGNWETLKITKLVLTSFKIIVGTGLKPVMECYATPIRGKYFLFLYRPTLCLYWSKCPVCTPDFRREAKVRAFRPIRVQYSL